jgi:halogenation protein CepH
MFMLNDDYDYDLIVAGGGPAGTTLATLVAMQNHRVLLLEREAFPRYQIGESLLPSTIHGVCRLLGISSAIENAGFPKKFGGTFRWGKNKEPWSFSFDAAPSIGKARGYAYQVERAKFDQILLDNARHKGVQVVEEAAVTDLIEQDGRVTGVRYLHRKESELTATAAFVADATGNQSRLAQRVGKREYSQFFQNVALFGYYENGKRLPPPNEGNIVVVSFGEGWFWYIPLSKTLTSVGAVIAKEHAGRLNQGHEAAMEYFISSCPMIQDYLAQARRVTEGIYGAFRVRKDYSYSNSRFWIPGMVLIGDAACFIDPIFSSGVHLGTHAALMAARSINTILAGELSEERCFEEFERRYRREFGNFYQFLIAFYDTNQDESSYFWTARKVLNTSERSNDAFIRLVAGVSSDSSGTAEDFFRERENLGRVFAAKDVYLGEKDSERASGSATGTSFSMDEFISEMSQIQRQAELGADSAPEDALFENGLIPTADGFRWMEPV